MISKTQTKPKYKIIEMKKKKKSNLQVDHFQKTLSQEHDRTF